MKRKFILANNYPTPAIMPRASDVCVGAPQMRLPPPEKLAKDLLGTADIVMAIDVETNMAIPSAAQSKKWIRGARGFETTIKELALDNMHIVRIAWAIDNINQEKQLLYFSQPFP